MTDFVLLRGQSLYKCTRPACHKEKDYHLNIFRQKDKKKISKNKWVDFAITIIFIHVTIGSMAPQTMRK